MFCLKPLKIVNPHYKSVKGIPRNHLEFQNVNFPDYYIQVPCGLCYPCLKRFQNDWRVRLLNEWLNLSISEQKKSRFLTLTVAPRYYKLMLKNPAKMIKHFRDEYRRIFKKSVRYWCITEYGDTTDRLHFHMLVFNTDASRSDFDSIWKYGIVNNRVINKKRIMYCISYITDGVDPKTLLLPKERKPKVFCSPGLGKSYCTSVNRRNHVLDGARKRFNLTVNLGGYNYAMPRYYSNKIFTDEEKRLIKNDRLIYMTTPKPPYYIGKMSYNSIKSFCNALLSQAYILHPLFEHYYE